MVGIVFGTPRFDEKVCIDLRDWELKMLFLLIPGVSQWRIPVEIIILLPTLKVRIVKNISIVKAALDDTD